jgi:hypothetical protein
MRRQIAYVLQDAATPLDSAAVIAALKERHRKERVEPMSGAAAAGGAAASTTMMLRCADVPLVVMAMAMPLPEAEWKLPALRVASQWPDARAVFSGHTAHLVVATLADPSDRLLAARSIAAVVGALIAVLPGCRAVLWENLVAHSAQTWEVASRDAFAKYPGFPYPLWVSLHPFKEGEKVGFISFGLMSFVGREIELEPQNLNPPELLRKAAALAVYLMQHGPVIKDGETFGEVATERILVRHVVSKRVPGLAVLHAAAQSV